jgi:hypothetical protein
MNFPWPDSFSDVLNTQFSGMKNEIKISTFTKQDSAKRKKVFLCLSQYEW